MRYTDYRIVGSEGILSLEELVKTFINDGWLLQGGVFVITEAGRRTFYQSLARMTLHEPGHGGQSN